AERIDGSYEIIDGQQRTISIAQYVTNQFSLDQMLFENLPPDKRQHILDYELTVYVCSGKDSEKLDWFKVINIAGETLTKQELRNAVYSGPWVADAKLWFSKNGCAAYKLGGRYVSGSPIRQEFLETAIRWVSHDNIEAYMSEHQHDPDSKALWSHFKAVIDWVKHTFNVDRPEMKSVDWGPLYDKYKNAPLHPADIEEETRRLIDDEDVQKHAGIYHYILTRDEKYLNIRSFPKAVKQRVYEKQNGKCAECGAEFKVSEMEADHITPWSKGGKTVEKNCQILCKQHNRRKGKH
ncbi:MAG: HNH endonuclease signature motif containing protein, partial [Acidimicrobiaceae bacterium]|nr:HNH endonuclease signature motif containing protein [Acidimicrobiaceae bacterium]